MAYTKIFNKIVVTCVPTGERDYLLYTNDSNKLFHLEQKGIKTHQQMEEEGWYPGDRQDLVDLYKAGRFKVNIPDNFFS